MGFFRRLRRKLARGALIAATAPVSLPYLAARSALRQARRNAQRAERQAWVPMAEADRARPPAASLSSQQWEAGRKYPTLRGELVRSKAEVRVANELHRRGLRYEYEPRVCGFRPDFLLPEHRIVIEYWGRSDEAYNAERRRKTAVYLGEGYALVSLGPGKGVSVEQDLGRQLYYKLQGK